jgi:hypothetical protein
MLAGHPDSAAFVSECAKLRHSGAPIERALVSVGHAGRLELWPPAVRANLLLRPQLLPAIAAVPQCHHGYPSPSPENPEIRSRGLHRF